MNYYAKGGEAHGLKSLAKELQSYGRNGDTMLAHINPQEAAMLKAMGGSGSINPHTGLYEYWGVKLGPIGIGSKYHGVSVGNTSIGDLVAKTGIVGQLAATYFGGPLGAAAFAGMSGGGKFDFKRALMAGAMAYGLQNLAQGVSEASGTAATSAPPADVSLTPSGGESSFGIGNTGATNTGMGINAGPAPVEGIAPSGATASGSVVPSNTGGFGISPGTAPVDYNPASFMDRAGTAISDYGSSIADKATSLPENLSRFTEGAGKLMTGDPAAIDAFKASGATMTNTALPAFMGYTGMAAIDEAKAQKAESDKAAAEAATLQAAETDRIEKSKQRGLAAMRANPYMFAAGGSIDDEAGFDDWNNAPGYSGEDGSYVNEEYLARRALEVPPESPERRTRFSFTPSGAVVNSDMKAIMGRLGADYPVGKTGAVSAGVSGIAGRMPEGMRARAGAADVGIAGRVGPGMARAQMIRDLASNQNKYQLGYDIPFSKGGDTARFLSGGGDGMSDSIKATINGEQPARLADGEFVIPADVVSHLGNGSSKAGAKQLYSMMDKVRSARTGTKQQGKQINPAKYMPA